MVRNPGKSLQLLSRMDSLADETRLRLLRLLENHELGVVDLCDVLQMPQSTVSRHLKVLADQGWCKSHRQGTNNLYRMLLDELEPAARRLWLLTRQDTDDWPTLAQDQLRLERRLKQRQSESQAFFASSAGQWDKLRTELYGNRFDRDAQLALLPSDWVVADLGCGTGSITASLAPHVETVIGVDQSRPMLKAAKTRTSGMGNVDLRKGALDAVPIEDQACDGAMLVLVLSYLPEPDTVLREAARILKPGGTVSIVDLLRHDREAFRRQLGQHCMGFEPRAIEELLKDCGFKQTRCTPLHPETDVKGPALFMARGIR